MTSLLVSVRGADEAAIALRGGAGLIDIKEPKRGPLGAATREVVEAVVDQVAGVVAISVALGELCEGPPPLELTQVPGVQFAKIGLSHLGDAWQSRWVDMLRSQPAAVKAVAVAYADWQAAAAPPPEAVCLAAVQSGCAALLLDTFDKRHGNLWQSITPERLVVMLDALRTAGITTVVGGSLDGESVGAALAAGPDFIAVRGAVCCGGRVGSLDEASVRRLAVQLQSA